MALANYTDLQASVAAWLNRTDLSAVIPDFVTLAEARISRDLRLRKQITVGTLTCVAGTRTVALPTDWLEFENLSCVDGGGTERQLTYVAVEHLDMRYPSGSASGQPLIFTIEGDNIDLGPTPDAAYTLNNIYYARFPALATAGTNWLLTNHPSIYLYLCLMQGALYLKDAAAAQQWEQLYMSGVSMLQGIDDRSSHSGSALRVRAI